MSKNRPDAGTLDIPIQRQFLDKRSVRSEFLTSRAPPARAFLEASGALLTGHTTRRRAGCPRSLAHPAARWWLRGTKKRCPGLLGGGAGAHSLGEWSVGLDRPSQLLAYKDLTKGCAFS